MPTYKMSSRLPFVNDEESEENGNQSKEDKQTPAFYKDFEKKIIEERKVFLWGAVDDKSSKDVVYRLLYLDSLNHKPITFYINSPGGLVTAGMVIYDTIQMLRSPVSTVCMGLAASMGSILLSVGKKGKRFIYTHGEVMIHQPSIGGVYQGTSADIEIQADQIQKTKMLGAQLLANNCNQSLEKILEDFERDYWMDAKEAIAYGIVDKIITKL